MLGNGRISDNAAGPLDLAGLGDNMKVDGLAGDPAISRLIKR
jgi:hypothetical protein